MQLISVMTEKAVSTRSHRDGFLLDEGTEARIPGR